MVVVAVAETAEATACCVAKQVKGWRAGVWCGTGASYKRNTDKYVKHRRTHRQTQAQSLNSVDTVIVFVSGVV